MIDKSLNRLLKIIFFTSIISLIATLIYADATILSPDTGDHRKTDVLRLFYEQEIAASGSATSDIIEVKESVGYFAVQMFVRGAGTIKIEYLISLDGVNFLEPSAAADIASGQTTASGPGTDGRDIFTFSPILAPYMKIKVTETGGVSTVWVTLHLVTQ
jgi:hypothetical protein